MSKVDGTALIDRLMAPTRIYVKPLLALLSQVTVHGLSHITGGGLLDNIPRVIPEGLEVVLERDSWPRDPVFEWLQSQGRVPDSRYVPGIQLRHRHDGSGRGTRCGRGRSQRCAMPDSPRCVIGEVRSGGLAVSSSLEQGTSPQTDRRAHLGTRQ